MNSKIIVKREEWDEFYHQAKIDKNNVNALNVPVKCAQIFQSEIRRIEKDDVKINIKHARIYLKKTKINTCYFIAQAFCNICKISYSIKINNEADVGENYVNVLVERHGHHKNHREILDEKMPQIRGEKREKLKNELKASGLTTKDFRYCMIADNASNIPSEDVLRQIRYSEKHKYDLCKGWRDNLIAFSIASQNLISGNYL